MSKNTPGPWEVGFKTGGELVILAGNEVIARTEPNRDNDIEDANARLIAAAPEMYKILKTLYEGPAPIAPAVYDPRFEKFYLAWMEMKELVKRIDGEEQED